MLESTHRHATLASKGLVGDATPGARAQGIRGLYIDLISDDHDPINIARRLDRDVFIENIFEDTLWIPVHGVPVAAAARSDTHSLITRANFHSKGTHSLFPGGTWK